MNGGKRDGITHAFFMKFKTECERIHTFIASLNPKLLKDVCKRKEFNIYGSLTNIILCSLENEILMYSVQYLLNEGFNVDVLVFDGCMIRKREGYSITDELLGELNGYVLEKTGYDFKCVEKELDTSIDLSVYESPNNDIEASITYYKDKEEFEKTHIKIIRLVRGRTCISCRFRTGTVRSGPLSGRLAVRAWLGAPVAEPPRGRLRFERLRWCSRLGPPASLRRIRPH
jgi:hypothetical protein